MFQSMASWRSQIEFRTAVIGRDNVIEISLDYEITEDRPRCNPHGWSTASLSLWVMAGVSIEAGSPPCIFPAIFA